MHYKREGSKWDSDSTDGISVMNMENENIHII